MDDMFIPIPYVTILILIDGFLQYRNSKLNDLKWECHNPYFNRWFSAIKHFPYKTLRSVSHNPYFNRWFSAIKKKILTPLYSLSHNPYFNRWFSAIRDDIY